MKKWLRSKTAWMAVVMGSIPAILEGYTPEIKQVISDKLGTEWGIVYGVMFAVAMLAMRRVTKEPISAKRGKSVHDNGSDQELHNDVDGSGDGDDGVVGLIPKTLSDSDIGVKGDDLQSREEIKRHVDRNAKRRGRGKRRR